MTDMARRVLALSAALCLGAACGDSAPNDGAPPLGGADNAPPSSPPPSTERPGAEASTPAPSPADPSSPASEAPAASADTPLTAPDTATPGGASTGDDGTDPSEPPATDDPSPSDPPPEGEPPPSDEPPPAPGPDPNFLIFLLIGQSNMEGAPASEPQDRTENPRVKVLALRDCPQRGQVHDQWYTASPSLHTCGNTLGPGDYFAKTLADALPDAVIGLVPDAIAGVDIDIFRKGVVSQRRGEFFLPPDNQRDSAYETVIERARLAQQVGVIRGILFHQGESDAATGALQAAWPGKLQELVSDIRSDLGLGDVPFLAGELLANGPPQNGCCGNAMNPRINSLPSLIPGAFVVSGAGLGVRTDGLHFDVVGQREFGRRYAQVMLQALGL